MSTPMANVLRVGEQRDVSKIRAHVEIEKLLGSSINDNGDEVAQFQADRFIADQFCMVWPEQKLPKEAIDDPPEAVALRERKGRFLPYKMNDNHNRQERATTEDAYRSVMDISQSPPLNESKIQPVDLIDVKAKELDSLLKESFAAYRLGRYSLAVTKYKIAWEMIADTTLKLRIEHINEDVICYMLCLSLLETDQLTNLLEAVELLLALEKRSSRIFPAVYYALSKAHHKHYRFALALEAIEEGLAFLEGDVKLTEYTIPGSDVTLKESTKDGLSASLAAMKDECPKWVPPDAVCSMGECLPSSRWYEPNRAIYFSDPAFNGMVVLTCNNVKNPCTIKFHQACWKSKKDQLSALKKLSDKDIIGYECFTPNCECGQGTQSLITRVEVYGDDGKLKTHIEPPANPVYSTKRRSLSKGAIPKQQVKPKRPLEKIRRPVATAVPRSSCKEVMGENGAEEAWRLNKLAELRRNNFGIKPGYEWRPDVQMYGNPQMIEIGDFLGGPIFDNDCDKLVAIKAFIFTYFYEFIKENGCVKKKEITQKWEEDKFIFDNHSDVLHGETDICEFLLQSYKLVSLGDRIGIAENLPELYTMVRIEVCECLKFLLVDSLHARTAHMQDEVSNTIISDCEEKKSGLLTFVADSDAKVDATVGLDKIRQANMTTPVTASPDSPQPGCEAVMSSDTLSREISTDFQEVNKDIHYNTCQLLQNDVLSNLMPEDISPFTESKSSNDPANLEAPATLPVIFVYGLEPNNPRKLGGIHDPNHYLEQSEDDSFDGELCTDPTSCPTSPQLVLNAQDEADEAELGVGAGDEISYGVCKLPQASELTTVLCNGLLERVSNKGSHVYDSDFGNCKHDRATDSLVEIDEATHKIKSRFDVTVREPKCISTNNYDSDGAGPGGEEIPPDNTCTTSTEFPKGSFEEKRDCAALTGTKSMEITKKTATVPASQYQDILAESNVQKIENDLVVMVKTVAQLKLVLEQNQTRSENHAQMLQQELINHKNVSQESMSELMKDLSRLEARCACLELEKSELMLKFQDCEVDSRQTNDNNLDLTLKNTEWMHKYDKLKEEKADVEYNFNLLLKEKSMIEDNLEMLQRERDEMDKKLQEYDARLKDESYTDSKSMSSVQKVKEQQILDTIRLNERKLKLQSLNHEFSINTCKLEKALEKCCDHISMLNDASRLITLITQRQFSVVEVQAVWQGTKYYLHRIIEQYKEEYSKLKASLESDKEIENLNDIKLSSPDIEFPQSPTLTEFYCYGKAKFIDHPMPLQSGPWPVQGAPWKDYFPPRYYSPASSTFYPGQKIEPRVNDVRNIPTGPVLLNNHCPQNFYANDNTDNVSQKERNINIEGAGFQIEVNTTHQGPIISANTRASTETLDFDSKVVRDDISLSLCDSKNGGEGFWQPSYGTTVVGANAAEGASQTPINRRSTPSKKIGRDLLMQELRKKFVGVPELDLLESVQNVRKLHNNTLSGMRVQNIIEESEPFVKQLQEKHITHYSPSKQMLPMERTHLQPNKLSQRKFPTSMPLGKILTHIIETTNRPPKYYVSGQQKRSRGYTQEQANKLMNYPPTVSARAPAVMKKRAWGPVTSGLVEWNKNQEDSECTICQDVYDNVAPVYILPCQHSFHTTCIKQWLAENSVCPICRTHCTMDDEFPPLPS